MEQGAGRGPTHARGRVSRSVEEPLSVGLNTKASPVPTDMTKEFACKDIGMSCGFKASAKTEEELMPKIVQHAKEVHKLDPIPAETVQKVKAAIKEKKGWF